MEIIDTKRSLRSATVSSVKTVDLIDMSDAGGDGEVDSDNDSNVNSDGYGRVGGASTLCA